MRCPFIFTNHVQWFVSTVPVSLGDLTSLFSPIQSSFVELVDCQLENWKVQIVWKDRCNMRFFPSHGHLPILFNFDTWDWNTQILYILVLEKDRDMYLYLLIRTNIIFLTICLKTRMYDILNVPVLLFDDVFWNTFFWSSRFSSIPNILLQRNKDSTTLTYSCDL